MEGGSFMLNFLVDYLNPAGVETHITYQANAGRQHRRLAAVEICRRLKAEGCTPTLIASIPGEYSLEELEQLCKKGPPSNLLPLRVTFELVNVIT